MENGDLRLGLRCVRGLRAVTGAAIFDAKPFAGIDELARRVPLIRKDELETLASVSAVNGIEAKHRRDALWKAGHAGRPVGPLLEEDHKPSPNRRCP